MTTHTLQRGLSESDAAIYLGISRSTLRHGRSEGVRANRMPSPPFVRLGRKIVYLRDDLDGWLAANRSGPGTTTLGRNSQAHGTEVNASPAGVQPHGGQT